MQNPTGTPVSTPTSADVARPVDFFVILTLAKPADRGIQQITITKTVTVAPGSSRGRLFVWMQQQAPEYMQGANVLFFSAEPDTIAAAVGA